MFSAKELQKEQLLGKGHGNPEESGQFGSNPEGPLGLGRVYVRATLGVNPPHKRPSGEDLGPMLSKKTTFRTCRLLIFKRAHLRATLFTRGSIWQRPRKIDPSCLNISNMPRKWEKKNGKENLTPQIFTKRFSLNTHHFPSNLCKGERES